MGKTYALVIEGRVKEIIKTEGLFANIPIEKRYAEDKIKCMFECGEEVKEGMDYNYETGEYTEHVEEIVEIEENVEEIVEIEENVEGVAENGEKTNETIEKEEEN